MAKEDNGTDATSIHGDKVWGTNTRAQPATFRTSSSKSIRRWSCHRCVPQEADPEGDIRMQEVYLGLTAVGQALWVLAPVGDQGNLSCCSFVKVAQGSQTKDDSNFESQ